MSIVDVEEGGSTLGRGRVWSWHFPTWGESALQGTFDKDRSIWFSTLGEGWLLSSGEWKPEMLLTRELLLAKN